MTTVPEAASNIYAPVVPPPTVLADDEGSAFWSSATGGAETPADTSAKTEPAPQPTPEPPKGKVMCCECTKEFGSLLSHVRTHLMTVAEYQAKYPGAPIVAEGVQVGRPRKDTPPPSKEPSNLLARASGIELLELDRLARDGFTHLDKAIQEALLGLPDSARTTYALAFEFSRRCISDPAKAEALPRWAEADVQAGTNPYYRPLKYLTLDVLSRELTSALTQWAAVYLDADKRGLDAMGFSQELKRRGRRGWYNDLPKPHSGQGKGKAAKGKRRRQNIEVTTGTSVASAQGTKETLSTADAKELLTQGGFTDPSKPAERPDANVQKMDAKTAAELLAAQNAQTEPDRWSLEEARAHFAPPQALVLWEADKVPTVLAILKGLDGFVRILDLDKDKVKMIVAGAGSDR